jgi:hypothetical protein
MTRIGLTVPLALVIACAVNSPRGDDAYCAELFDQLDAIEQTIVVPRPLPLAFPDFRQQQLARIRQAGCLTMTADLAGMEDLGQRLEPATGAGAAFPRPVAVQVGVVTSMQDDARAKAFFESLGYRARSVGAPGLGRKVYVEATSQEALQAIVSIARQAGFIGPYPSRYVTF